jgi:hypothetical protein
MTSRLHGQFPDQLSDVGQRRRWALEAKRGSRIIDLRAPSLPFNQLLQLARMQHDF